MRYVTVNEITGKVVGVGDVSNRNLAGEPSQFERHIFEEDWAVTEPPQNPSIGDEWDGAANPTFTSPPSDLSQMDRDQLLTELEMSNARSTEISMELRNR